MVKGSCLISGELSCSRLTRFELGGSARAAPRTCISACRGGRACTSRSFVSACREGRGCTQRSCFSACRAGRVCTPRNCASPFRACIDYFVPPLFTSARTCVCASRATWEYLSHSFEVTSFVPRNLTRSFRCDGMNITPARLLGRTPTKTPGTSRPTRHNTPRVCVS